MIAATRGPASLLPTWIQFRRPSATGRIAFSAKLLLNSRTGEMLESSEFSQPPD